MRRLASLLNPRPNVVSVMAALLVGGAIGLAVCMATDLGGPARRTSADLALTGNVTHVDRGAVYSALLHRDVTKQRRIVSVQIVGRR